MREQAGSGSGAWDLILQHRESMMRVALARTGNRQDAEDVVQEAIARAAAVPELRASSAGSMLRSIVINLCIDRHRRAEALIRHEGRFCADDRTLTPLEDEVCDRSEARWLHRQIRGLGGTDQEVLLHRAAGHTVRSAASKLGLTYKGAESAFTRGRQHARTAWQSTLAVLHGGAAAIRRVLRSAPAMTATVAAAFLLTIASLPEGVLAPPPGADPGQAQELAPRQVPFVSVVPAADIASSVTPHSRVSSDGSVPRRTVLRTGPVGDRRVVQTGVGVEHRHPEETLVDTVERCVENGVIISPTKVDCL
jgi:RNA polymerase sigma-70 factor (ECF subfamily)